MNKQDLLNEIDFVWGELPYPDNDDYFKAIADREYQNTYKKSEKKYWWQISKNELLRNYDFLFYLKDEGVRYYLATYMGHILRYDEVADNYPSETIFMVLGEINLGILNPKQIKIIFDFLSFCFEEIHPRVELDVDLLYAAITHINTTTQIRGLGCRNS